MLLVVSKSQPILTNLMVVISKRSKTTENFFIYSDLTIKTVMQTLIMSFFYLNSFVYLNIRLIFFGKFLGKNL